MLHKQDFRKIDFLGSGKKDTKIYKVEHIATGKIYALKEIEARSLEKLNECKVLPSTCVGGSSGTNENPKSQEHAWVLRLLLLRDHAEHVPSSYGVRIH